MLTGFNSNIIKSSQIKAFTIVNPADFVIVSELGATVREDLIRL